METRECYVGLHHVAKDRVMARTKASLAYLAHAIETARQDAMSMLCNEFGLEKNNVAVQIGWKGDLDRENYPYNAVVTVDFGLYDKESVQNFVNKIRNLSTYPIRDGVLGTLTEINAVYINDRVFGDVDTDEKIGNNDFFEVGVWVRDALYVLCSKIRLNAINFIASAYWDANVDSYLIGKNNIYSSDGHKID